MKNYEKELANFYGETFDVEINEAIAESEATPHKFSQKFEKEMAELIKTGKPKQRKTTSNRGKRILVIAIAAALALVATACAVPEIRESIAGFFVKIFSNHVEYSESKATKESIEVEYGIIPIPEGFEISYSSNDGESVLTEYVDDEDNIIKLIQGAKGFPGESVDNEHGDFYEYYIGDIAVRIMHNEYGAQAAWLQDGYYFSIVYTSPIELEEFETWIKSVRAK